MSERISTGRAAEGERRECCVTCRWWNRAKRASWTTFDGRRSYEIEHAQCRRHAPLPRPQHGWTGPVPEAQWPHANADDWCGDHEPQKGRAAESAG